MQSLIRDTSTYYLQVWLLLLWEIEEVQAAAEWQQQQYMRAMVKKIPVVWWSCYVLSIIPEAISLQVRCSLGPIISNVCM